MKNASLSGKPHAGNPLCKRLICWALAGWGFASFAGVPEGYVTKGSKSGKAAKLTAFWDAVDNQGTGEHDPNAATWVDLVGNQAFQLTGTTWGENFLKFAGAGKSGGLLTGDAALDLFKYKVGYAYRYHTIELVFKYDDATSEGAILIAQKASGIMATRRTAKMWLITTAGGYNCVAKPGAEFCVLSMERDQYYPTALRYNDVAQTLTGWESPPNWLVNDTEITIGGQADGTLPFAGRLYAIRVYEGQLTEEEAAQNYQADLERYNSEPLATVVSGSVTVGGRTYGAGQVVKTPLETTALEVESATDAMLSLDPRMTGLAVADGAVAIQARAAGAVTFVQDVTLGATAVLGLPADGLCVSGALTAEPGAAANGPGTLIARPATCPVSLTGGAKYVSSTAAFEWPSSGTAYIPPDQSVGVTADDRTKIEGLDKIVFLGETAKVTYALPDAWAFGVPMEGPGTFAFASAGDITISADNANLTGCFYFTNTTVLVTHERGLGSTKSQTCHFWPGDTTPEMPYGHPLDFDNGQDAFTNRVALYLHPLATKNIAFGAISSGKTLVQDADFSFGRYNLDSTDKINVSLKNNVRFLRHLQIDGKNTYQYVYLNGTSGGSVWILGTMTTVSSWTLYMSLGFHIGWPSDTKVAGGGNIVVYADTSITCEKTDVFKSISLVTYQTGSAFDLNGFDQSTPQLCSQNGGGSVVSGTPIVRFTSATPASFRITGSGNYNVNPTFTGAAGFTKAGTGTYGLYGTGGRDTTGELKVESGTLNLAKDFSWGGTNVTVQGGTLVIAADAAKEANGEGCCLNRQADLVIAAGATLEIGEGRTERVRSLKVGDDYVKAGTYGGPESSAPNKLDCLAGRGLLYVRRNAPDVPMGLLLLVK